MHDILTLEADRRAINITVNSIDTDLDMKQREKLYPTIGLLYPEGTSRLAKATDIDAEGRIPDNLLAGLQSAAPEYGPFMLACAARAQGQDPGPISNSAQGP